MPKIPARYLDYHELPNFNDGEMESARPIDQSQLNGAKIFSSREEYIKSLPKGIKYMEIGVAWGYYSNLVCDIARPSSAELLDPFDNDLKCWSWRKFGSCQCTNQTHELLFTPETHEQWIKDTFSKYENVKTIKARAPEGLPEENDYDYIYVDISNERISTRNMFLTVSKMIKPGGIMGINDYVIYDAVIDDDFYGTFQSVHEFLFFNKNWVVDAIALQPVGFYDIYLRRIS